MSAPLAYFLTWTVYGSWLHGDERGSVDDEHNIPGTPRVQHDAHRFSTERSILKQDTFLLPPRAREVIEDTVRAHCTVRKWNLLALNARTNHIHVVVWCDPNVSPERALDQFKAWATRRLREAGLIPRDGKVWTRHGSTRWINDRASLAEAIDYVMNQQ